MTKPWEAPRKTKKKGLKLTPESLKWAESRAKKAGRRYPNLIDNMAAARQQAERNGKENGTDSRP